MPRTFQKRRLTRMIRLNREQQENMTQDCDTPRGEHHMSCRKYNLRERHRIVQPGELFGEELISKVPHRRYTATVTSQRATILVLNADVASRYFGTQKASDIQAVCDPNFISDGDLLLRKRVEKLRHRLKIDALGEKYLRKSESGSRPGSGKLLVAACYKR
eukprot:FR737407.1.p1 GENE.FR737407.1~~FR737407.1.p1  ORF type:complete len:161 (+),score=2.12 FR737407.1:214-696(+)